jgi:hypothetical protein
MLGLFRQIWKFQVEFMTNHLPPETILALFDKAVRILTYLSAILIIYGAVLYFFRPKYLKAISKRPIEAKKRLQKSSLAIIRIIRLFIFMSPIYILVIPFLFHFFIGINLPWMIALYSLLCFNVIEILIDQKWIAQQLTKEIAPQSTNITA